MHAAHRLKQIVRLQRQAARGLLDLVRQYVEQHLGVAVGVDMAVIGAEQLGFERLRVGQVAVVHQHDAERRVDVKRLRLFLAVSIASSRVAHLTKPAVARQRAHVARAENVTHHALGLVHEELALLLRHNAGGVLAAVLQQKQRVIDKLINRCAADNADDSTHYGKYLPNSCGKTGFKLASAERAMPAPTDSCHQRSV